MNVHGEQKAGVTGAMERSRDEGEAEARPLSVLLIEDDPADAKLIDIRLSAAMLGSPTLHCATSLEQGLEMVQQLDIDLVLMDLGLPDGSGIGNVDRLLALAPETPIIVLTGLDDERTAIEAVRRGAQDYLVKGDFNARTLVKAVWFATERHRLRCEVEEARGRERRVVDRLLAHLTEHLKGPLSVLRSCATSIIDSAAATSASAAGSEQLQAIEQNADALEHLVDALSVISADQESGIARAWTFPGQAVARAVAGVEKAAAERDVTIDVQVPEDLPRVPVSPSRIEQVVRQLLTHAVSAVGSGQTLVVSVELADDQQLVWSVGDASSDMAEDVSELPEHDPFQGKDFGSPEWREALGFGLSREIVVAHGGRIWQASGPQGWSYSRFSLPI